MVLFHKKEGDDTMFKFREASLWARVGDVAAVDFRRSAADAVYLHFISSHVFLLGCHNAFLS